MLAYVHFLGLIFSSEFKSITDRDVRCLRKRRIIKRRSGEPAVVLLSIRPRRLRMIKQSASLRIISVVFPN